MRFVRFCTTMLLLGLFSSGAARAADMIDLPANAETTAMTYVYCLTGDTAAATNILEQRIKYAGGNAADAARWVAAGYCSDFLAMGAKVRPALKDRVLARLSEEGFESDEPASTQAAKKGKKGKKGLGKIIRGIGKFLGGIFGGGVKAGGKGTYIEYSNSQTGESMSYCDRSWGAEASPFGETFEPTPFYPEG